jgi:hypothetical protein
MASLHHVVRGGLKHGRFAIVLSRWPSSYALAQLFKIAIARRARSTLGFKDSFFEDTFEIRPALRLPPHLGYADGDADNSIHRDDEMRNLFLASAFLAGFSLTANATDSICEAVALHSTVKTETFGYPLRQGESIDAVTQYNVNKKTGETSYCSHGGGCYPAEALRLTNSYVDKSKVSWEDDDEKSYGLVLIRSKVPPAQLRQNDVELKLLEIGMCNACAGNAAAIYVKAPESRCAKLVRKALEGDPAAVARLNSDVPYCREY